MATILHPLRFCPPKINMKTKCLLFAIAGFGPLMTGLGFAGELSNPGREPVATESGARTSSDRPPTPGQPVQPHAEIEGKGKRLDGQRVESPASGTGGHAIGRKTPIKRRPGPPLAEPFQGRGVLPGLKLSNNAHPACPSGNAAGLRQSAPSMSAGGAQAGSSIKRIQTPPSLAVAGVSHPPPPNALLSRRDPGPSIIGGPTMSRANNSSVINGTGMKHRP